MCVGLTEASDSEARPLPPEALAAGLRGEGGQPMRPRPAI
jgi:hypothetical protein